MSDSTAEPRRPRRSIAKTTSYQVRVDIGSAGSSAGEPTDDDAGEAPSLSAKAKGKRRARDSSEDSMISKFTVDSEAAAEEEEESDDDDAAEEDADDSADSIVPEEPDPSGESDAGAGTVQLIRATLAERKGRGPQAAPASKGKAHKGQASHAGTPGVFDFRTPTYAQATGATYTLSPTSRLPGAFDDAEANFGYGKPLIQQDGVSPETRVALLKQWVPIPFGLDWPYVEDLGYWPKLPGITPIERERPPLTLLTSDTVAPYLPSQLYPAKSAHISDFNFNDPPPTDQMDVDADGEGTAPDHDRAEEEENDGSTICLVGPIGGVSSSQQEVPFARFESHRLDEYLDTKPGYVVNAGGPVYALDWCPHDDTERPSPVEYLALGAYSQSRALIPPAAPALVGQNPGLIQIWALDATQASDFGRRTSEAKGPPMRLALGICIDVGEAWRLQWRPLQAGHTASGGLGHLAGVFGDGSLCIFDVPDPAQIQDATSTPFVHLEPVLRLTLPDAALNCLDWSSSDTLIGGACNGNIAVWQVAEALRLGLPTLRPSTYVPTETSPLLSICAARIPPSTLDGQDRFDSEPTTIVASNFSGACLCVDLRDPYVSAQVMYERGAGSGLTWSPYVCLPLIIDPDHGVRILGLRPGSYSQTARMLTMSGRVQDIAANYYAPFYAVASAEGAVAIDSTARHQTRQLGPAYHARSIYRLDFDRKNGLYRLIDNEMPAALAQNRGSMLDDALKYPPAYPPHVAVTSVAWCRSIRRAHVLSSGMACGLVRVDMCVDESRPVDVQEVKALWTGA